MVFIKFFLEIFLKIRRVLLLRFCNKKEVNLLDSLNYEIDLVYVTHSKDSDIFVKSLNSALEHVRHRINQIIVVYPEKDKFIFRQLLINYSYQEYTDEALLAEFIGERGIGKIVKQPKASNWLKQQILKLLVSYKTFSKEYLVVDSDTIFIDDIVFIANKKPIFYYSDELHFRYKKFIKKVLKTWNYSFRSYIAHMMVFDKNIVDQMLRELSNNSDSNYITNSLESIIDSHSFIDNCVLSEYELYSFYVRNKYRNGYYTDYWRNLPMSNLEYDKVFHSKKFYSLSFHHYNLYPELYK